MNGGNGGGSRGLFGMRPAQTERLSGDALGLPWKQYRQLLILHACTISSVFAVALLIGPAAKAIVLGLFLAYGTWWFWLAEHDSDARVVTTLGGLLFLAVDAALFLYWPLLLTVEFPWQWYVKLWAILILADVAWEAPFLKARYEQEIVDPSYSAPRAAIDGRYPPQTNRTLQKRMDYEALPPLPTEVEPEPVVIHSEALRVIDANMHGRAHLVRSIKTRAGEQLPLDKVHEMLAAQPAAGFARSEWVGEQARGWTRKLFDSVRLLLEERGLIQPHSPGNEACLHTWEPKMDDETDRDYWRAMTQVTIQKLREIQND